jgi:hypothetical protein
MKTTTVICVIAVSFLGISSNAFSGEMPQPLTVEVLYMDHGPMQPSLRALRSLFPKYGNKIKVFWYDFESEEGARFKSKKGIDKHIPLIIWLEEKSTLRVNGRSVTFSGFPEGTGPFFARGEWTLEELKMALDEMVDRR